MLSLKTIKKISSTYAANPRLKGLKPQGKFLKFEGLKPGEIIYNPTLIQEKINGVGKNVIMARVESQESDWLKPETFDPHAVAFEQVDNYIYAPVKGATVLNLLEDPAAKWIYTPTGKKRLIVEGTRINRLVSDPVTGGPQVESHFHQGDNIFNLDPKPFAVLPGKDARLVQRANGKIVTLARPWGDEAGKGTISILPEIDRLEDLKPELLEHGVLLKGQVPYPAKAGANEAHAFFAVVDGKSTELIGVLGHIGFYNKVANYFGMIFVFDPDDPPQADSLMLDPKIIFTRFDFPYKEPKRPTFGNVVFPSAILRLFKSPGVLNETVDYLTGVDDASIAVLENQPNPFLDYQASV